MKRAEVRVGGIYAAKVSEKVVPVRLDQEHPAGGWVGTNLVTSRSVRIRTAARLRYEFEQQEAGGRTFLARKGSKILPMGRDDV